MCDVRRLKKVFLVLFMALFVFFEVSTVRALELQQCEYSDEYKKWLELPEEEKSNFIMPSVCKVDDDKKLMYAVTNYSNLETTSFPTSYSITDVYDKVYDQGSTETCWAFSSASGVESYLAKKNDNYEEISPFHMEYKTAANFMNQLINPDHFGRTVNVGGNIMYSYGYFANGYGPVKKSDFDTKYDISNKTALPEIELNKVNVEQYANVNDTFISFKIYDDCSQAAPVIKNQLVNYGAVNSSIYLNQSPNSPYVGAGFKSYYYNGDNLTNHAITIVGWDDNYSVDNFGTLKPSRAGAWKVLNSYGSDWGEDGYFYVSYEDTNICRVFGGVTDVDFDIQDNVYSYDTLINTSIYYEDEESKTMYVGDYYAANVFEKVNTDEVLTEVRVGSFFNTFVEVYVVDELEFVDGDYTNLSIDDAVKVGEGQINVGGYKTVKLDKPYIIKGDKFAILVKYKSLGDAIAVSGTSNEIDPETGYSPVTLKPDVSFMSGDGKHFDDLYLSSMVASIKALTNNIIIEFEEDDLSQYKIDNYNGGEINVNVITSDYLNGKDLDVKVLNANSKEVDAISISTSTVLDNQSLITITIPSDEEVDTGTYTLVVSYGIKEISIDFDINIHYEVEVSGKDLPSIIYDNIEDDLTFDVTTMNVPDDTQLSYIFRKANDTQSGNNGSVTINDNKGEITLDSSLLREAGNYLLTVYDNELDISSSIEITIVEYVELEISIDKELYILDKGVIETLNPKFNENATRKEVVCSVDDEEIVNVTNDCVITAIEYGFAVVTIQDKNDSSNKINVSVFVADNKLDINDYVTSTGVEFDEEYFYTNKNGKIEFKIKKYDIHNGFSVKVLNSKLQEADGFNVNVDTDNEDYNVYTITYNSNVVFGTYKLVISDAILSNNNKYNEIETQTEFIIKKYIPVTSILVEDVELNIESGEYEVQYKVLPVNATYKDIEIVFDEDDIDDTSIELNNGVINVTPGQNVTSFGVTIKSKDNDSINKTFNVNIVEPELVVIGENDSNPVVYSNSEELTILSYPIYIDDSVADSLDIVVKKDGALSSDITAVISEISTYSLRATKNLTVTVPQGTAAGTYVVEIYNGSELLASTNVVVNDYVPLTQITFDKEQYVIGRGDSIVLDPTLNAGAFKNQITWESSDESVITVDENGEVIAVGKGTATIKAVSKDIPAPSVKSTTGILNPESGHPSMVSVATANGFKIESGAIAYYGPGTTAGNIQPGNRFGIEFTAPSNLVYDDFKYAKFKRTMIYEDGTEVVYEFYFDGAKDGENYIQSWPLVSEDLVKVVYDIDWTIENHDHVEIEIGEGVELEDGPQKGYSGNRNSSLIQEILVSPNNYGKEIEIEVVDSTLTVSDVEVDSGVSFVEDELFENKDGSITINYTSQDINNIVVNFYDSYNDLVTGFSVDDSAEGKLIISYDNTVVAGDYKLVVSASYLDGSDVIDSAVPYEYEFVINSFVPVTSIEADNISIFENQSASIIPSVLPGNATYSELSVEVGNSSIVTVDGLVVTPQAVGTTTITLKAQDGSNVTKVINVEIKPYEPIGITLEDSYTKKLSDGSFQLVYTINPSATSTGVTWSSSDESIATVSSTGLITFVSSGTVTITATAIGYPNDQYSTTLNIIDTKVNIVSNSVEEISNASFKDKLADLFTYHGGKVEFDVKLEDVNNITYQVLNSEDEDVSDNFEVTVGTVDSNGISHIVVSFDGDIDADTYKVIINGKYLISGTQLMGDSDNIEFTVKEFIPVTEIDYDDFTLEIGGTQFLDNKVLPQDASYKTLSFVLLDKEDDDDDSYNKNSVSIRRGPDNRYILTGVTPGRVRMKITALDGYLDEDDNIISKIVTIIVLEEDLFRDSGLVNEDGIVTKVEVLTSVSDLIDKLNIPDRAIVQLLDREGNVKEDGDIVATGDVIHYVSGATGIEEDYTIVIAGDCYPDGKISPLDYVAIRNHLMGTELQGVYALAADFYEDGKISALDYVAVRNYLMEGNR